MSTLSVTRGLSASLTPVRAPPHLSQCLSCWRVHLSKLWLRPHHSWLECPAAPEPVSVTQVDPSHLLPGTPAAQVYTHILTLPSARFPSAAPNSVTPILYSAGPSSSVCTGHPCVPSFTPWFWRLSHGTGSHGKATLSPSLSLLQLEVTLPSCELP